MKAGKEKQVQGRYNVGTGLGLGEGQVQCGKEVRDGVHLWNVSFPSMRPGYSLKNLLVCESFPLCGHRVITPD